MKQWRNLRNELLNFLCPPGNGVYTVHTAQERRENLQKKLYADAEVQIAWQQQLDLLPTSNLPLLLGICSDSGGGILRGANWGPLFIREYYYALTKRTQVLDLGDVRVIPQLLNDELLNQETIANCRHALYGDTHFDLPVSPLSIAYATVSSILEAAPEKKIFSLGGDHSISYPTIKAYLEHKPQLGIIHFDAHTDLLDYRLGIAICFATWAYHLLDLLSAPGNLIQLGIRSSAKDQKHWESTLGIKQYWAEQILNNPLEKIIDSTLEHLSKQAVQQVYITVDIDSLDQSIAASTGTPEPNGLTPEQIIKIIEAIGKHYPIVGADLTEVAPLSSPNLVTANPNEPDSTLQAAANISQTILTLLAE